MSEVKNKTTKTTKTTKPKATTTKKKTTPKKVKEDPIIDVEEMVEVPAEEVKETPEDATKRLFGELNTLVKPLYEWLASNFDANTSIEIRRERILVLHDSMVLNVVQQPPQEEVVQENK